MGLLNEDLASAIIASRTSISELRAASASADQRGPLADTLLNFRNDCMQRTSEDNAASVTSRGLHARHAAYLHSCRGTSSMFAPANNGMVPVCFSLVALFVETVAGFFLSGPSLLFGPALPKQRFNCVLVELAAGIQEVAVELLFCHRPFLFQSAGCAHNRLDRRGRRR